MKYLKTFRSHLEVKSKQVAGVDANAIKKHKNYRARSKYANCVLIVKALSEDIPKLIDEYDFLKKYIKEELSLEETLEEELEREYKQLFNRYSKIFNMVSVLDDDWDYVEKYL